MCDVDAIDGDVRECCDEDEDDYYEVDSVVSFHGCGFPKE